MQSLVDSAINVSMGTLVKTHGIPVVIKFADSATEFNVGGIYNENGILNTMSASGMPMESIEIQIGFRKSDFVDAGQRVPTIGDIVVILSKGRFRISRKPTDDGSELTCGLKEFPDA